MPRSGFVSAATSFEKAIFSIDPNVLLVVEQELLTAFAKSRGLKCMTKAAFIGDDLRATSLGFNLPRFVN